MPPRLVNGLLIAVALLAIESRRSIAETRLSPTPAIKDLPPAPTVIGLPEPSRLRAGVVFRRPDGSLGFSPAPIRVEKLLAPVGAALMPGSLPFDASLASGSSKTFELLARELAPRHGLDPDLVVAVIAAESGFRSDIVSPRGAVGLMQLMPQTARRFGVRDRTHPGQNMRGGMSYLRWLLSYFRGNVELALAAYNAGEHAVDRHLGIPPYAETREYVAKVMGQYRRATHPFDPGLTAASPTVAGKPTGNRY